MEKLVVLVQTTTRKTLGCSAAVAVAGGVDGWHEVQMAAESPEEPSGLLGGPCPT